MFKKLIDLLRRLGVISYGGTATTFTNAKEMPISFINESMPYDTLREKEAKEKEAKNKTS